MLNQIIAGLVPILITVIVGVLAVIIKAVGNAAISYIQAKEKEILQRIEQSNKEDLVNEALKVWQLVDEHFRITNVIGDKLELKVNMFSQELLKRVPGLTQEQVCYLRQTIAGQVNKGKTAIINPVQELTSPTIETNVSKSECQETLKIL